MPTMSMPVLYVSTQYVNFETDAMFVPCLFPLFYMSPTSINREIPTVQAWFSQSFNLWCYTSNVDEWPISNLIVQSNSDQILFLLLVMIQLTHDV